MGSSKAEIVRSPKGRLRQQPRERPGKLAAGGTRGRSPRRGVLFVQRSVAATTENCHGRPIFQVVVGSLESNR
jgi:hypothetical protein